MHLKLLSEGIYKCINSGQIVTILARDLVRDEVTLLMQNGGTRKFHIDELIIYDEWLDKTS